MASHTRSVEICGINAGSSVLRQNTGGKKKRCWKTCPKNQGVRHRQPRGIPVSQNRTYHWWLCGARETALIPPPHLVGQLRVAEVSTQGHGCGHVNHVHRRPMAGRDKQIHVVEGTLAPHKILGAADHLVATEDVAQGEEGNLQRWVHSLPPRMVNNWVSRLKSCYPTGASCSCP